MTADLFERYIHDACPWQDHVADAEPSASSYSSTPIAAAALPPPLPSFYRAMPPPPQLHPSTLSHLLRHRSQTSVSEPGTGAVSASVADASAFLRTFDDDFHADRNSAHATAPAAPCKPPAVSVSVQGGWVLRGGSSDRVC